MGSFASATMLVNVFVGVFVGAARLDPLLTSGALTSATMFVSVFVGVARPVSL